VPLNIKPPETSPHACEFTRDIQVKRYQEGKEVDANDVVVQEAFYEIYVNGHFYAEVFCSPNMEEFLVVGRLVADGVLRQRDQLSEIDVKRIKGKIYVTLCSHNYSIGENDIAQLQGLDVVNIVPQKLTHMYQTFIAGMPVFRLTGGTHGASLATDNAICFFAEDISRHSAIDKVIVLAWQHEGIKIFLNKFLFTTGRISCEVVKKAVAVNIPVIVSKAPPTHAAVSFAEEKGRCLIGFLRNKRFTMYTNPPHIQCNV
jgi:FdhD protein